jgi:hypothetical protein
MRINGFNPIGSVKAGLFLVKSVDFTIYPIIWGISKIIPECPPIRPVKTDQNCESKPGLNLDGCISLREIMCWEGKMRNYPLPCA